MTSGSNILEIGAGAGAGAFTARLSKKDYIVSAVDLNDDKFDVDNVDFRKVSVDDSLIDVFDGNKFDAIASIEIIEHFRGYWDFCLRLVASYL